MKTPVKKIIHINYLHPGIFFSETSNVVVESTQIPKELPRNCYGFYFTETEFVNVNGKEFKGDTKTVSKTFIIGTSIHVDDVPEIDRGQRTDILKSNIRSNSPTKRGIKTHLGNWQAENEDTVVISPSQFTFY